MLLGTIFDISQLLISLVDAVSDAAVAWEFYINNQMVFFYIIGFLFICGAIVDAFIFVIQTSPNGSLQENEWYIWIPKTIFLVPFGPILPALNYLMEQYNIFGTRQVGTAEVQEAFEKAETKKRKSYAEKKMPNQSNDSTSKADSKNTSPSHNIMDQIDSAISLRQATFYMINVQACVEVIPSCVVQLIAVSVQPNPSAVTPLQLTSLALSLASIAVKLFQLARSYTLKVFVAKFLFLFHDLFALAFISSSVFSSSIPEEYRYKTIQFSSSFPYTPCFFWCSSSSSSIDSASSSSSNSAFIVNVTPLSYYWFYTVATTILLLLSVVLIWFTLLLFHDTNTSFWVKTLVVFIYATAGTCLILPFTFVFQAVSLTWLLVLEFVVSPDFTNKLVARRLVSLKNFIFPPSASSSTLPKKKLKLPATWRRMFMNCTSFCQQEQSPSRRMPSPQEKFSIVNYFFDFCCSKLPLLPVLPQELLLNGNNNNLNHHPSENENVIEDDLPVKRIQHALLLSMLDEAMTMQRPMKGRADPKPDSTDEQIFTIRKDESMNKTYLELVNLLSEEEGDDDNENNKVSDRSKRTVKNSLFIFSCFMFSRVVLAPFIEVCQQAVKKIVELSKTTQNNNNNNNNNYGAVWHWVKVIVCVVVDFVFSFRPHSSDNFIMVGMLSLVVISMPMAVFSLFYPFIHVVLYAQHYNSIMIATFLAAELPFLFCVIFLLREIIEYFITNMVFKEISCYNHRAMADGYDYFHPDGHTYNASEKAKKEEIDGCRRWHFMNLVERSYWVVSPVSKVLNRFCLEDDSKKIPHLAVEKHVGVFLTSMEIKLAEKTSADEEYDDIVAALSKK